MMRGPESLGNTDTEQDGTAMFGNAADDDAADGNDNDAIAFEDTKDGRLMIVVMRNRAAERMEEEAEQQSG